MNTKIQTSVKNTTQTMHQFLIMKFESMNFEHNTQYLKFGKI